MSETTLGASVADPLAGVERPSGDPGALVALGGRYEAGSASLTSTARELAAMVARVLGQSWSGAAAASCGASCLRSAQVVLVAGQAYGTAGSALRQHGARLAAAQADWDAARRLADEAMVEERARHQAAAAATAAGTAPLSFADMMWQSPLRNLSRARAEQAVADANGSARQTAAVLDGTLAPFRPPAPAPVQEESHWYDQIVGFGVGVKDGVVEPVAMVGGLVGLNGDVSDNWSALGSGLWHGVTHPAELGKAVIGWDDLSQGNYGHWAGELLPGAVAAFFTGGAAAGVKGADAAAAAGRAGDKLNDLGAAAKGLPGALKDVKILVAQTPEGLRLPAGVDASSLRTLWSEAMGTGGRRPAQRVDPEQARLVGGEGKLERNALNDREVAQAEELKSELGGEFKGQERGNTPGIDGWYNGQPASFKEVSPDSKHPLKALADNFTKAQASLSKAGIEGAVLIVRAPGMTVAEIMQSTRAGEILAMGGFTEILVRGSDGWVRF